MNSPLDRPDPYEAIGALVHLLTAPDDYETREQWEMERDYWVYFARTHLLNVPTQAWALAIEDLCDADD